MSKLAATAVAILCAMTSHATAFKRVSEISNASAAGLLEMYVQTWSANNAINPERLAYFYDRNVLFYGKLMPRGAILQEKLQYIAVWPERRYWIVPGTVSIRCDADRTSCQVSGVMGWNRRSNTGVRSTGEALLSVVVTGDSNGKIVRESARILREQMG